MKKKLVCALLAALAFTLIACGQRQPGLSLDAANVTPPPLVLGPDQDWDNPILGTVAPSIAAATKQVSFNPLVPKGLGNPIRILVQAANPNVVQRSLAFLYDTAAYGRVVILEWLPQISASDYAASLQSLPARRAADPAASIPGSGYLDTVTIRGGIVALRTQPDDQSTADLRWVEGSVVVNLSGPTLNHDQVVELANGL